MKEFIDYVMSFYGPGGVYDMDATVEEVKEAIVLLSVRFPNTEFVGDSIDREHVREIIIDRRKAFNASRKEILDMLASI